MKFEIELDDIPNFDMACVKAKSKAAELLKEPVWSYRVNFISYKIITRDFGHESAHIYEFEIRYY